MATSKPSSSASTRFPKSTPSADAGKAPAELIDARIASLPDWRGALLAQLRGLILAADAGVSEEWKWNTPVWSCQGIICTGETYKKAVKLTFAKGAHVADPDGLFNASLQGNLRRAIDFTEHAPVQAVALTQLVRAAIALNRSTAEPKPRGR